MTEEPADRPDDVAGLPVEEAAEVVVAGEGPDDADAVRAALAHVADDGVVSWAAADDAVAHVSKVVSTPETRVELAGRALADARDVADGIDDVETVAVRIEEFESRLERLHARTEELSAALQRVVGQVDRSEGLYEVGAAIQRLTDDANAVQAAADDLSLELEEFETWAGSQSRRYTELGQDVDALSEAIEDLGGTVDVVANRGDPEGAPSILDVGGAWADLSMRERVMRLFMADLQFELDDLRTLDDRIGEETGDRAEDVGARHADIEARLDGIAARIDDLPQEPIGDHHRDVVSQFEAAVAGLEPPVSWGEVQGTLQSHRAMLED